MRVQCPEYLSVSLEGSSTEGESGPKAGLTSVIDGYWINIPVLFIVDNMGRRRLNLRDVGYRFKLSNL
jgi:hypothetical protein